MDPRKIVTAAAVVALAAGLAAGCAGSGARRGEAAASARPTATAAVTSVSSTTAPASTTTSTSTTTTATTLSRPATARPVAVATASTAKPAAVATCPHNLASELASTGSARQLITVEAAGWNTTEATVELWQRSGACWTSAAGPWSGFIGQNGFSDHKIEGDGTTPTGMYGLGTVMYGNAADPGTREPYHQLVCGDWWDEDPRSPQYNTFQHVPCGQTPPFGGGSEALWQETAPYPSFAVIDYNTGPVVEGAGSGIFFHASTGGPTVGCVSVPLGDLDLTLRWLDPSQAPIFVMGPATEITRY